MSQGGAFAGGRGVWGGKNRCCEEVQRLCLSNFDSLPIRTYSCLATVNNYLTGGLYLGCS